LGRAFKLYSSEAHHYAQISAGRPVFLRIEQILLRKRCESLWLGIQPRLRRQDGSDTLRQTHGCAASENSKRDRRASTSSSVTAYS